MAASLASSSQRELVIGRGPYLYWNEVPTPAPPDGSDTYAAVVGDVITFRYNNDNNVYLMATEADWESCDFGSATKVGDQTMDNAPQDFLMVGLTNVYRAVLKQPGTLYFSCNRDRFSSCDHCTFGQKIKVSVSGAGERPPRLLRRPPATCLTTANAHAAMPTYARAFRRRRRCTCTSNLTPSQPSRAMPLLARRGLPGALLQRPGVCIGRKGLGVGAGQGARMNACPGLHEGQDARVSALAHTPRQGRGKHCPWSIAAASMLVRYHTQVPGPGRNARAVKRKLAGQGQRPF